MAEAIAKTKHSDFFESYSAGTEVVSQINSDAVRIIKDTYHYDMSNQKSKDISELPEIDIVITMGCNVVCPTVRCSHMEDWGLQDPTGQSDIKFIETIQIIEEKLSELRARLENRELNI